MIEGQLDIFEVIDLVEKEQNRVVHICDPDDPVYPGMRAPCGAVLEGIDLGVCVGDWKPQDCIVCVEIWEQKGLLP